MGAKTSQRRRSNRSAGRAEDGFTLIELLVVVVILGILSAVVVFSVRGSTDKGRPAAVAADARTIRTAEEAYCAQHGKYVKIGDVVGEPETLVGERFLSAPSQYNKVDVQDPGNGPGNGPCHGYGYVLQEQPVGPADPPPSTPPSTATPAVESWVPLSPGPTPRHWPSMVEFPPTHSLVLFGGEGPGPEGNYAAVNAWLGDTWVWAGSWALASPGLSSGCPDRQRIAPCPRRGAVMAYDGARGKAVLVGGESRIPTGGSKVQADTWTWDGTSWAYAGPGPQTGLGAMAYDPVRREVVLFSGSSETAPGFGGPTDATWIWNGTNWREASPGPRPPARQGANMAFDPVSKRLILFGGYGGPNPSFGDTWAWDGSSWSQLAPAASPGARQHSSMASDSKGRIVLFGGTPDVGPVLDDTWEWEGSTWLKRQPSSSPPGKAEAGFAYHEATSQFVLFGGVDVADSPETWGYVNASPPAAGP